jgi:adenylosuccinate synthase
VHYEGKQHTFSSFGSGSLKGARTYISEFCTLDPMSYNNERNVLIGKVPNLPNAYINENTMLTTPFDILEQQASQGSNNRRHGTVGVGFGTTLQRNEDHFRVYARDILFPHILEQKLIMINKYYYPKEMFEENNQLMIKWMHAAEEMAKNIVLVKELTDIPNYFTNMVFEGAQGVLLDQNYGFFPHVTRSNTTVKNAFKIIQTIDKNLLNNFEISIYNITRAYQTRHGNGPMTTSVPPRLTDNIPEETNVTNKYQGEFKKKKLDVRALQYAIMCNRYETKLNATHKLVVTCMDHLEKHMNTERIFNDLKIKKKDLFISYSPEFSFVK